jgi:hypothetical protein
MGYLTKEQLAIQHPKMHGFEELSESKIGFISDYFELSECTKIVLHKEDQPHMNHVIASFTNGTESEPIFVRDLIRWMHIESGTL